MLADRGAVDGSVAMPFVAYSLLAYANNGISGSGPAFWEQRRTCGRPEGKVAATIGGE
jgi:hypothetical protein